MAYRSCDEKQRSNQPPQSIRMPSRTQIGYAERRSRSHDAVIRVYDEAGNGIETHEHKGDFHEP
jgi:hypothetical protein